MNYFEETVEILDLLSNWGNLESIEIDYKNGPISEIADRESIINELKIKLFKRWDLISEVIIVQDINL